MKKWTDLVPILSTKMSKILTYSCLQSVRDTTALKEIMCCCYLAVGSPSCYVVVVVVVVGARYRQGLPIVSRAGLQADHHFSLVKFSLPFVAPFSSAIMQRQLVNENRPAYHHFGDKVSLS
jgi:hypothetical protein